MSQENRKSTKALIDRNFKKPSIKFEPTKFEGGGAHTDQTIMLAGDIQCGNAAENSKAI